MFPIAREIRQFLKNVYPNFLLTNANNVPALYQSIVCLQVIQDYQTTRLRRARLYSLITSRPRAVRVRPVLEQHAPSFPLSHRAGTLEHLNNRRMIPLSDVKSGCR